jgi:hypothetical protein
MTDRDEPAKRTVKPDSGACSYCGAVPDAEERTLVASRGKLVCSSCARDGCFSCMPAGRGAICPECEDGDHE